MTKESPLRRIIADAKGYDYRIAENLQEARTKEGYYLVMEGDDGGQIYLSYPASLVQCDENTLEKILIIIDENQWSNFDNTMRRFTFERFDSDRIIPGGMGGGFTLKDDLWVHEEIADAKLQLKEILMRKLSETELTKKLKDLALLLPKKV